MTNAITLTVSQLNEYVKALLDSSELLNNIYIKGEISNFTNHYKSGHLYFTLKDDSAALKAVMFRSSAVNLRFMPENGMKVIVRGRVSAFVRDGVYQMYAEEIQPDGLGSLYLAYEQLKEKLALKGMFDPENKKTIPRFPSKIGIITADTGAAVADMKNIITRRYPVCEILIYPALVQGQKAPEDLCRGIRYFNTQSSVDTIIIGRGGGSIEDLWAFNSEMLAYEIFQSNIPVISAVGHETDFTICDFVADLRAPTPSAAAELAVPDISEVQYNIASNVNVLKTLIDKKISDAKTELNVLSKNKVFTDPFHYTKRLSEKTEVYSAGILRSMTDILSSDKSRLSEASARLSALSPLSVLSRGYSIVTDANGKAVSVSEKLKPDDNVTIKMYKGSAEAIITHINKGEATDGNKKES